VCARPLVGHQLACFMNPSPRVAGRGAKPSLFEHDNTAERVGIHVRAGAESINATLGVFLSESRSLIRVSWVTSHSASGRTRSCPSKGHHLATSLQPPRDLVARRWSCDLASTLAPPKQLPEAATCDPPRRAPPRPPCDPA
jgi:hypothetical protein